MPMKILLCPAQSAGVISLLLSVSLLLMMVVGPVCAPPPTTTRGDAEGGRKPSSSSNKQPRGGWLGSFKLPRLLCQSGGKRSADKLIEQAKDGSDSDSDRDPVDISYLAHHDSNDEEEVSYSYSEGSLTSPLDSHELFEL